MRLRGAEEAEAEEADFAPPGARDRGGDDGEDWS